MQSGTYLQLLWDTEILDFENCAQVLYHNITYVNICHTCIAMHVLLITSCS